VTGPAIVAVRHGQAGLAMSEHLPGHLTAGDTSCLAFKAFSAAGVGSAAGAGGAQHAARPTGPIRQLRLHDAGVAAAGSGLKVPVFDVQGMAPEEASFRHVA
jgi:hypothetical protein